MILDQYGRPYEAVKKPDRDELGSAVVYLSQREYVTAGLTPERLASIFKEADRGEMARQAELFEALEEKDAHIIGEMGKRRNVVNEIDFVLDPASEDPRDVKIAEFVEKALDNIMDFEDVHASLQDAIGKGYASFEITWDISSGQAVPTALEWLPQSRFRFVGPDGILRHAPLLISDADLMGMEIPAWKTIFHQYGGKVGNGTRSGIYRVCAWMFLFKNYSIKDWITFCEIFGMPLRIGKYEPGAGPDEKNALKRAIRMLGSDAAGIIPKNTDIEFVETTRGSASADLWEKFISFCNREISKAILGQAQAADSKSPGSFASDKVKDMVRKDLIRADTKALARSVRWQLIRPIVGFNFGWDAPLPEYYPDLEEQEDLDKKSIYVGRLIDKGLKVGSKWVRREFGIDEPEKDDEILVPVKSSPETPQTAKQTLKGHRTIVAALEAQGGLNEAPETMQTLNSQLENAMAPLVSAMIDKIRGIIEESTDLEEAQTRIAEEFPDATQDQMVEIMQLAFVLAELQGRADIMEETE